jgi:hypothetical protein
MLITLLISSPRIFRSDWFDFFYDDDGLTTAHLFGLSKNTSQCFPNIGPWIIKGDQDGHFTFVHLYPLL